MGSISVEGGGVNAKALFAAGIVKAQAAAAKQVGDGVGKGIDGAIDETLGRKSYERREHVGPWIEMAAECHRCKSQQSRRFQRNGHRERTILTLWGEVQVWVQRLVCVNAAGVWSWRWMDGYSPSALARKHTCATMSPAHRCATRFVNIDVWRPTEHLLPSERQPRTKPLPRRHQL